MEVEHVLSVSKLQEFEGIYKSIREAWGFVEKGLTIGRGCLGSRYRFFQQWVGCFALVVRIDTCYCLDIFCDCQGSVMVVWSELIIVSQSDPHIQSYPPFMRSKCVQHINCKVLQSCIYFIFCYGNVVKQWSLGGLVIWAQSTQWLRAWTTNQLIQLLVNYSSGLL